MGPCCDQRLSHQRGRAAGGAGGLSWLAVNLCTTYRMILGPLVPLAVAGDRMVALHSAPPPSPELQAGLGPQPLSVQSGQGRWLVGVGKAGGLSPGGELWVKVKKGSSCSVFWESWEGRPLGL